MKKILFLLPLLNNALTSSESKIILEASVIKIADGTIINVDRIEFIMRFRRKVTDFMCGELQPNNQRKAQYKLCGEFHTVESLARIEEKVRHSSDPKDKEIQKALQALLKDAKADFISQSAEFIVGGRLAKNVMLILIQEDCQKRNRPNSLLLEWGKTKEGQEALMFEKNIKSFADYYTFLVDLANFLLDVVHSCPKAEAHYNDRWSKWKAVRVLLPVIFKKAHVKEEQVNELEFLKYLKKRYLDSLTMDEITPEIMAPLLLEYIKKHTYACN